MQNDERCETMGCSNPYVGRVDYFREGYVLSLFLCRNHLDYAAKLEHQTSGGGHKAVVIELVAENK